MLDRWTAYLLMKYFNIDSLFFSSFVNKFCDLWYSLLWFILWSSNFLSLWFVIQQIQLDLWYKAVKLTFICWLRLSFAFILTSGLRLLQYHCLNFFVQSEVLWNWFLFIALSLLFPFRPVSNWQVLKILWAISTNQRWNLPAICPRHSLLTSKCRHCLPSTWAEMPSTMCVAILAA